MEKKNGIFINAMNYGLILGLALVVYILVIYFAGIITSQAAGYLSWLIIIGGLVFLPIHYRDKVNGGVLNYGQAIGLSVLILVFASFIYAFFNIILYKFIDPGLIDQMLAKAEEQLLEKGLPEEQIEMALGITRKFMDPFISAILTVVGTTIFGTIIALITSAFIKKEKNPLMQQ